MSERMRIIAEDAERITMLDYFEGKPVRFYKDKATGEVHINGEDMAMCMGYESLEELMATDHALDAMIEYNKEHPGKPMFKDIAPGPDPE
jgi:hypothetical protein